MARIQIANCLRADAAICNAKAVDIHESMSTLRAVADVQSHRAAIIALFKEAIKDLEQIQQLGEADDTVETNLAALRQNLERVQSGPRIGDVVQWFKQKWFGGSSQ